MSRFLFSFGLVAISALLMSLAHPSAWPKLTITSNSILNTGAQETLAWFALVPLLFLLDKQRGWRLLLWAFLFGMIYFSLSLYWINISVVIFGHIHPLPSIIATSLLHAIASAQYALALFWGFYAHRKLGISLALTLPTTFTAFELCHNYLFSGFPWGNIAYSQYLNLPVLQTAAIWGVYGIVFMLVLSNTVIFSLVKWWRSGRENPLFFPKAGVIILVLMVGFSFTYGFRQVRASEKLVRDAAKIKVALLQGNIDQEAKNQGERMAEKIFEIYRGLALQIPEDVELVVWPEVSFPYTMYRRQQDFRQVLKMFGKKKFDWFQLVGAAFVEYTENERFLYNSAVLIDPNGDFLEIFDKSHLVPFSEFMPFKGILPINKLVPGTGQFYPGELGDGLSYLDRSFGVLICYEGIFPEISRVYENQEVEFLVNLTNDAWFGVSSAPYQHLAFYTFRAVETRKAVFRATNTGISAVISPSGKIVKKTGLFERTAMIAEIPRLTERTLYGYIGDIPAWGCVFIMIYWMLHLAWPSKRKAD